MIKFHWKVKLSNSFILMLSRELTPITNDDFFEARSICIVRKYEERTNPRAVTIISQIAIKDEMTLIIS